MLEPVVNTVCMVAAAPVVVVTAVCMVAIVVVSFCILSSAPGRLSGNPRPPT